jgi:hypothetical protein
LKTFKFFRGLRKMALTYYVTKNTSSTTTGYYTINYGNYGYGNTTGGYFKEKTKQDYKNKEVKHLLQKERGW